MAKPPQLPFSGMMLSRYGNAGDRYGHRLDILLGFHLLAAGLICLKFAVRWSC
jgi:hypothetical protein